MMDLDQASDARLLAATAPGTAGPAFAAFYGRYERAVLAFHQRRARHAETAADLTAETFLQALSSRRAFRASRGAGREDAAAWLFGIAGHVYARHARRSVAESRRLTLMAITQAVLTEDQYAEIDALAGPGPLEQALCCLPENQRDAVRAFVLDDRSYDDIAATLDVAPATVRKRVSRGLAALRAATKETR